MAGRFRGELTDRFASPLYAFAAGLIGFAALGEARTTRQGRGVAIAAAVLIFVALRMLGVAVDFARRQRPARGRFSPGRCRSAPAPSASIRSWADR